MVMAGVTPPIGFVEQICPLANNRRQTITNVAADTVFVASNTTALSGLLSTVNSKLKKAFLIVQGTAVNTFAGTNTLNGAGGTENILQVNYDGGAWATLSPNGQFADLDLHCEIDGASHPIFFVFDITTALQANVDAKIGFQWKQARTTQVNMVVTLGVYAKLVFRI